MDSHTEILGVGPRDHIVLFYADDEELAQKVGGYLLDGIRRGGAAIVAGTRSHRLSLARMLVSAGIDLAAGRADGTYSELDASEAIARFVVSDHADPAGFWSEITPLIRRAAGRERPVRIFGEMVSLLWDAGLAGAAIEVEAMWNELGAQFPFSLVCTYPIRAVVADAHADPLTEVCRAHSVVAGDPPSSMRGWRF